MTPHPRYRRTLLAGVAAGLTAAWAASPAATLAQDAQPTAQREAAPRATLAEQVNARVDALMRDARRWFSTGKTAPEEKAAAQATLPSKAGQAATPPRPPLEFLFKADTQPLGERLNRGLDAVVERGVPAARDAVRQVGLDGPVLSRAPVQQPPDSALPNPQRLNLLQAWQAARANDPALRAARASQASAQERMPQARSQLMPQVQMSSSRFANELRRDGLNSLSQPLQTFDRYDSANDTLSMRQPLVRAQQAVAVRQARSAAEEADAIFDREHQDFSVRVVQAYLEALLALDTLQMMETQRRFLEAARELAQRAIVAGTGTRTDLDAAQARLDLNTAQTLEARQQVDFSRRQLQAYVNQPFVDLARLDEAALARWPLPQETLEQWVRRAELESPEVRRLTAQRSNLSLEFEKARMGHLPTLDLVAQAQRSRSENTLAPQSKYENRAVGLQLNVPLYNGGYVNSVTRQAAAELERVEETLRGLRLDLGVRVHREYRSVTEGQLRIRALEQAVYSADIAVDSARKSLQAGVRTAVDVLNAEQQAMQARRDLAQARYGALAALVRLQSLVGQADEALVARVNGLLLP